MKRATLISSLLVIALLVVSTVFSPAASADAGKTRVIVQFAPGQRGAVEGALRNAKADFHYAFDDLEAFAVTLPVNALKGIQNNPNVVLVEEDAIRYPISVMPSKVSVDLPTQVVPFGIDMVQARDVWDADKNGVIDTGAVTGSNRTICIIDSGFYTGHEDLAGINVTGYTNVALPWNQDGSGHGSHVAGTIAAVNNALGVVGVTPGTVNLYIVRVFGNDGLWAYASTLIDAAKKCQAGGANIISMSLGGARSNTTERRGFDTLYSQGILSIAAAGNDGVVGVDPYSYPASYASVVSVAAIDSNKLVADFSQNNDQVELAAPGVHVLSTVPYLDDTSITVDGIKYSGGHIEFSARGAATGALVDGGRCLTAGAWTGKVVLCERGDVDFNTKVQSVQSGGGVAAVIYNNVPGDFLGTLGEGNSASIVGISLSQESGQFLVANKIGVPATVSSTYTAPASSYEYYDGTSMATPHVSAVAALVWGSKPTATNVQVRDALQKSAFDLGAAGKDIEYGYGLVQAKAAITYLGGGGGGETGVLHVGSVVGSYTSKARSWTPKATITVLNATNAPVGGVTVTGTWSSNPSTSITCVTATDGKCAISTSLSTSITSVKFTVTNLAKAGYTYTAPSPLPSVTITR